MKYSIFINQAALAETKLDLIDCAILDWLYHYCNSKNKAIDDRRIEGWTWISYSNLMNDMPLLRIKTKSSISKRIANLKEAGYIDTILKVEKTYVKMTEKADELHFSTVRLNEQSGKTVRENAPDRSPKETVAVRLNEPTSNTNNSTTKTKEEADGAEAPTPKEYTIYFFDEMKKLVNGGDSPEIKALLKELYERNGIDKSVFWAEIKEFCAYWNELTPNGKRKRWELEKTFEVGRRLTTWFNRRNFKQFSGSITSKPRGKTVSV